MSLQNWYKKKNRFEICYAILAGNDVHTVVVWRLVMEALLLLVVRKGGEVFDDGVDPHMCIFNDEIITSRSETVQRSSWCLELRIVRCGSCSFLSSSSAGRVLAARVVNQQPAALRKKI